MPRLATKNYPRAPITEAVIEIRLGTEVSSQLQEKVVNRLRKHYPSASPLEALSVNIDTTGGQIDVGTESQGFRLVTDDQADTVFVQPNGVSIARLAPYLGWPSLKTHAETVWNAWLRSTDHHPIARLGIRYINRIDIPAAEQPVVRLEDYLLFYPQVPDLVSRSMRSYMMQVTVPADNPMWTATITSTTFARSPLLDHISLLLDIDLFRTKDIPQRELELWAVIDQARDIKNDIFENCITDNSRKLFS